MIEFWLTFNNGNEKLRLPVPPPEIEINTGVQNTTVNIHEIGEVNLIGKRKLKAVSFSSYFPLQGDPIAQYTGYPDPAECMDMVSRWRDSGNPIRLLIVGDTLKINEAMAIENFNVKQKHGPQDIYFTLELKEYRYLGHQQDGNGLVSAPALLASYTGRSRPFERDVPATYIFQEGDTLWELAKRFYGDGSRWEELKSNSGIEDEGAIEPGTVIYL